jgi:hypothetical protein
VIITIGVAVTPAANTVLFWVGVGVGVGSRIITGSSSKHPLKIMKIISIDIITAVFRKDMVMDWLLKYLRVLVNHVSFPYIHHNELSYAICEYRISLLPLSHIRGLIDILSLFQMESMI